MSELNWSLCGSHPHICSMSEMMTKLARQPVNLVHRRRKLIPATRVDRMPVAFWYLVHVYWSPYGRRVAPLVIGAILDP